MAYIDFAYADDSPAYRGAVNEEVTNLVNYLNNNTSGTTWNKEDWGHVPYDPNDYKYVDDTKDTDEKEFITDVVNYLDNNEAIIDGENIVIAHAKEEWGYGRSYPVETDNGTNVHGCTVYAGSLVGEREIRGFTWHEAIHSYGANHNDATYKVDGYDRMYDITPMTMSYLHAEDGTVDTTWEGGAEDPYEYCWGRANYAYPSFKDRPDRHNIHTLSDCSLDEVQGWIDYHY